MGKRYEFSLKKVYGKQNFDDHLVGLKPIASSEFESLKPWRNSFLKTPSTSLGIEYSTVRQSLNVIQNQIAFTFPIKINSRIEIRFPF